MPLISFTMPDFGYNLEDKEARMIDVFNTHHDFKPLDNTNKYGILYAQGKYDNHAVYIVKPDDLGASHAYAVSDKYYFERLYWLGTLSRWGINLQMVYGHMLHIYEIVQRSHGKFDYKDLDEIEKICWGCYPTECRDVAIQVYFLVYYGMIAEENHANSKVGSLIKIYGLHELLMNQKPIESAVTCLQGCNADSIKKMTDSLGIIRL